VQVFDEADADAKAGRGALAAVLLRTGMMQANFSGAAPEFWLCPIAEPAAGAATQWTVTITASNATGGTLIFSIAGRLVVVGISAGDGANSIASAIKAAADAMRSLIPFTASVAANVVTFTHTTRGVNGNDAPFDNVQTPAGVTCTLTQSVPGSGVANITSAVQALYDHRYHAVALSNHAATDIATLIVERAAAWGFAQQNERFSTLASEARSAPQRP
jgi:phage tail sheath gpL-like